MNLARIPLPDPELTGVFDRAVELVHEMFQEYVRTETQPDVTERAKNLFHEVLVKVRSGFDVTWMRVWEKHGRPKWNKPKDPKITFPIFDASADFDEEIADLCGKKAMLDLASDAPQLLDYIRSIQPFASKNDHWSRLRDLSNLGKHVKLAKQVRRATTMRRFTAPDGGTILWSPGCQFNMPELQGVPIDPATHEPAAGVENVTVAFTYYDASGRDQWFPDLFCFMSVQYGESVVAKVLSLLKPRNSSAQNCGAKNTTHG